MQEQAKCFLCGRDAERSRMDQSFEDRWHYECSSSECGDYIIPKEAMDQLDPHPGRKRLYCDLAKDAKNRGKCLEFVMTPDSLFKVVEVLRPSEEISV